MQPSDFRLSPFDRPPDFFDVDVVAPVVRRQLIAELEEVYANNRIGRLKLLRSRHGPMLRLDVRFDAFWPETLLTRLRPRAAELQSPPAVQTCGANALESPSRPGGL